MGPALCEVFADEYTKHMKRLRSERNASVEGHRSELCKVRKDIDRVIQAIMDGVPGSQVKDKMAQLEARKLELEGLLDQTEEMPVAIHSCHGQVLPQAVAALREALNEPADVPKVALVRTLVDRIVLTPEGKRPQAALDRPDRGPRGHHVAGSRKQESRPGHTGRASSNVRSET